MKITALLVLKAPAVQGSETVVLANATDVSQFGFFQRPSAKEFILFAARTIAGRTPLGRRQTVEQDEYVVHCYNRNNLCGLAFADKEFVSTNYSLSRSLYRFFGADGVGEKAVMAFDYHTCSLVLVSLSVLDEYQANFGDSWQSKTSDSTDPWPYLPDALAKFQNPTEADKLMKIQKDLDETKVILHKTIDTVLARGEKLDTLVDKSNDLSSASQLFYKQAKKANQCCTIL